MQRDNSIHNYHLYRRLVRRGVLEPITHYCGAEYYSQITPEDDEFMLVCPFDGIEVKPGVVMLDKIARAVERYNE